jgi:pimeloyl-ACP methyl ester carboxylesterase
MISVKGSTRVVRRTDGTSIHYTVRGPEDGPTWLRVHDWGCRRTDFAQVTSHLPAEHRVIAVDLAGHGNFTSDRAQALRATRAPVTTLAVRALLDPVAVHRYGDRITFVAHDLGSHHLPLEQPDATATLLLTERID